MDEGCLPWQVAAWPDSDPAMLSLPLLHTYPGSASRRHPYSTHNTLQTRQNALLLLNDLFLQIKTLNTVLNQLCLINLYHTKFDPSLIINRNQLCCCLNCVIYTTLLKVEYKLLCIMEKGSLCQSVNVTSVPRKHTGSQVVLTRIWT